MHSTKFVGFEGRRYTGFGTTDWVAGARDWSNFGKMRTGNVRTGNFSDVQVALHSGKIKNAQSEIQDCNRVKVQAKESSESNLARGSTIGWIGIHGPDSRILSLLRLEHLASFSQILELNQSILPASWQASIGKNSPLEEIFLRP